ncbi:MAG: response regulator [Candidatus Cloacimonetes bacterium]|nr:response regulator [Candidatus Cloacimonadota bacterium]
MKDLSSHRQLVLGSDPDKRILIIEDDDLVTHLLEDSFKDEYDCTICHNGFEAVDIACKGNYAIILLDYNFPKTNGLEILTKIRNSGVKSQVILVTGYPSRELAMKFKDLDVLDFVAKPFKIDKLKYLVNRAWDNHCTIQLNLHLHSTLNEKSKELALVHEYLEVSNNKLDETRLSYEEGVAYQSRLLHLIDVFQEIGKYNDLDGLQAFIISSVTNMLQSDRSSLFIVDAESNELYSKIAQGVGGAEIRFPIGVGIAGSVAKDKETILIPDAYCDDRFNPSFDKQTGYRTRNILCMAMINIKGQVIGVIQVLNKLEGDFDESDIHILTAFNALAAMSLESVLSSQNVKRLNSELQLALQDSQLILDHIHEGFCIVDRKGFVANGYSTICRQFFGRDSFQGFSILDHPFSGLDKEGENFISNLGEWIEMGFDNPSLDFWEEMSQNIELRSCGFILNVTLKRIGSKDKVEAVMLNLQDVSEAHRLAKESAEQLKTSNLVLEISHGILSHGQLQYYSYLNHQDLYLEEIVNIYAEGEVSIEQINKIFRSFHSLKGLVMTYGMSSLAELVHLQEDLWQEARDSFQDSYEINPEIQQQMFRTFEMVEEIQSIFTKLYPEGLFEQLSSTESEGIYQYSYSKSNLSYMAISQLLKSEALLHAESLNKEIKWITQKRDLVIPVTIWDPLRNIFSHLIKNSIDHGLESSEERTQLGKDTVGYLFFDCYFTDEDSDNKITFIFKDDGQGIDPHKIREKALQKGIISSLDDVSIENAHNLIFSPGFSTASEVSLISGRGVGMDIVIETVKDLNGEVTLKNEFKKGLEINITLPNI